VTAAEIAPLPASAFVRPSPYRDQRWLLQAARELRAAQRGLDAGAVDLFLFAFSRASLNLGFVDAKTPSWERVCRALSRMAVQSAKRLTINPEPRR